MDGGVVKNGLAPRKVNGVHWFDRRKSDIGVWTGAGESSKCPLVPQVLEYWAVSDPPIWLKPLLFVPRDNLSWVPLLSALRLHSS